MVYLQIYTREEKQYCWVICGDNYLKRFWSRKGHAEEYALRWIKEIGLSLEVEKMPAWKQLRLL